MSNKLACSCGSEKFVVVYFFERQSSGWWGEVYGPYVQKQQLQCLHCGSPAKDVLDNVLQGAEE